VVLAQNDVLLSNISVRGQLCHLGLTLNRLAFEQFLLLCADLLHGPEFLIRSQEVSFELLVTHLPHLDLSSDPARLLHEVIVSHLELADAY
jgi:hypothetical protein